jgi:hypothetical protein
MHPEYPGKELLAEIGRVTIAGSRLDLQMGFLWFHLDHPNVDVVHARRSPGWKQEKEVRRLTSERLRGEVHDQVITAVEAAALARSQRNEVIHQDWVLRIPPSEYVGKSLEDVLPDLLPDRDEISRTFKDSPYWQRVPNDSVDVVSPPSLGDLQSIERALAAATNSIQWLTFRVASSRDVGKPEGYIRP